MTTTDEIYTELKRSAATHLKSTIDSINTEVVSAVEEGRPVNPKFTGGFQMDAFTPEEQELWSKFFTTKIAPYVGSIRDSVLHAVAEYLNKRGV